MSNVGGWQQLKVWKNEARHENKPCMRCGRKGGGRSGTNESRSRVRSRGGVSGGSLFKDAVAALPARWLCAPGGWAEPPRCPARGAGNTGGLCLLRVGARWLPSGVCRNPGGGREDRGRQRVRATFFSAVSDKQDGGSRGPPETQPPNSDKHTSHPFYIVGQISRQHQSLTCVSMFG